MIVTLATRKARIVERQRSAAALVFSALSAYAAEHEGRFSVFGSFARGDFGPESDLDIMVEFPAAAERDAREAAETICRRFGLVPDVHLASEASDALLKRVRRDCRSLQEPGAS